MLESFPVEILLDCFGYLPYRDLLQITNVNRRVRNVILYERSKLKTRCGRPLIANVCLTECLDCPDAQIRNKPEKIFTTIHQARGRSGKPKIKKILRHMNECLNDVLKMDIEEIYRNDESMGKLVLCGFFGITQMKEPVRKEDSKNHNEFFEKRAIELVEELYEEDADSASAALEIDYEKLLMKKDENPTDEMIQLSTRNTCCCCFSPTCCEEDREFYNKNTMAVKGCCSKAPKYYDKRKRYNTELLAIAYKARCKRFFSTYAAYRLLEERWVGGSKLKSV
ncbi:hypothetical protein WR25_16764 [Diploscapter pachys]|uniref:F-box domain-containing protein n=1 Tax=Diploscapter pachys TaxID=2018661 RepID=A0A2A2L8F4_9BILA|nr:hypothetical protein WR25_16764 [Diploscapter pachys]